MFRLCEMLCTCLPGIGNVAHNDFRIIIIIVFEIKCRWASSILIKSTKVQTFGASHALVYRILWEVKTLDILLCRVIIEKSLFLCTASKKSTVAPLPYNLSAQILILAKQSWSSQQWGLHTWPCLVIISHFTLNFATCLLNSHNFFYY